MMLARRGTSAVVKKRGYYFEPKLDGIRATCEVRSGQARLTSRNGRDLTGEYPGLIPLTRRDCELDGEIVAFDSRGDPSFSALRRRTSVPSYVVFDVLWVDGRDVRSLPLTERKALLEAEVQESANVRLMPYTEDGESLWRSMVRRGLEGVMAKRKESRYVEGRSDHWLKVKNELSADCVIVGYTTGRRTLSSLALALWDDDRLVYVGKVGTGFSEQEMVRLLSLLKEGEHDVSLPAGIRKVAPDRVCEVRYLMLTDDGKLRAPVYVRLREDKDPDECSLDQVRPL